MKKLYPNIIEVSRACMELHHIAERNGLLKYDIVKHATRFGMLYTGNARISWIDKELFMYFRLLEINNYDHDAITSARTWHELPARLILDYLNRLKTAYLNDTSGKELTGYIEALYTAS